ncbi:MAG: hypothetical protein KIH63_002780 [Candidatus Saccharibacteria bacterium]|nr:hypothetical protein [Candidatus Saccharibacteria bacterium]
MKKPSRRVSQQSIKIPVTFRGKQLQIKTNHYKAHESKGCLVIAGGLGEGNFACKALAQKIAKELSWDVITYDIHYHSVPINAGADIERFARKVTRAVIEHLDRQVTVLAHSGATLPIVNLSHQLESIEDVILLSPLNFFGVVNNGQRDVIKSRYTRFVKKHTAEGIVRPLTEHRAGLAYAKHAALNLKNFKHVFALIADHTSSLPKSYFIGVGANDLLVSLEEISRAFPDIDQHKLYVFKDRLAGHYHLASRRGTLQAFELFKVYLRRVNL